MIDLDETSGDVRNGDAVVHLTTREFAIFELLWRRFPSAVPTSIVLDVLECLSNSDGLSNSSARVSIWSLRRKLAPIGLRFENIWGFGYRLKEKEASALHLT